MFVLILTNLAICLKLLVSDIVLSFIYLLGLEVDSKCQAEMQDASSELFSDYNLNPEIVAHCELELGNKCKSELKSEGGALDCLMNLGEELSKACYKAVSFILLFIKG